MTSPFAELCFEQFPAWSSRIWECKVPVTDDGIVVVQRGLPSDKNRAAAVGMVRRTIADEPKAFLVLPNGAEGIVTHYERPAILQRFDYLTFGARSHDVHLMQTGSIEPVHTLDRDGSLMAAFTIARLLHSKPDIFLHS